MTGMCPYYKISTNEETGYVWPGYSGNLSSKCEFYFTARAKEKKIHLRFTDLILFPGDKITVKDTKDGKTLASYSERNSPPARTLISEGQSVRLVFTPGHTGTSKSRYTLFHQASGKMCRLRKKDQARNSFLHYTLNEDETLSMYKAFLIFLKLSCCKFKFMQGTVTLCMALNIITSLPIYYTIYTCIQ